MKKHYHLAAICDNCFRIFNSWSLYLTFALLFTSSLPFSALAQEKVETFTSSGTWTVPDGVTQISVEAWGAGGGGGNRTSNGYAGGGGGGAYSRSSIPVIPGQTYSVSIGEGGTSGVDGGNTIFGSSIVVAAGGKSGDNNNASGVSGGLDSESVGDIRFSGGNGAAGGNTGGLFGTNYSGPGGGAAGSTGNGKNAAGQNGGAATADYGGAGGNSITNQGNGNAGSIYGGGGSGAIRSGWFQPDRIGGAGASGFLRISYIPGYRAEISTPVVGSSIWEIGEERAISVEIKNTGQATWISDDVELGIRWSDGIFQTVDPAGLAMGESRNYQIPVTAPSNQGSYTFEVVVKYPDGSENVLIYSEPQNVVPSVNKYYSYKSGSWKDVTTWTHDPSGTTQVGNSLPTAYDEVYVLSGRHVHLATDVNATNIKLIVNSGGILDLATYQLTGTLASLSGQGTLRLASAFFPAAADNAFVLAGGGTVEYYNGTDFVFPNSQATYNNLVLHAPGVTATQKRNLVLNGDLLVRAGTFRINDNANTRYSFEINGDVTVNNGASLIVGTGNTTNGGSLTDGTAPFINYYSSNSHTIIVKGDFVNNGTIRFTNQSVPDFNSFPSEGFATVYFQGATDNLLYANGQTDFYNLVLDKGLDQTYKLTVQSTAYSNFRLFGRNDLGGEGGGINPNLRKALWIRTGSLVLEGMTVIPALTEGEGGGNPNGDYYIPANAALVLNGPEVIVLSTADDYREIYAAYGVSASNNNSLGLQSGGAQSFSIYGKLVINDGYMSTRESGGIITWDEASGHLEINGGFLDVKQIRAAGGASGKFAYQQSGGTVALRGRFQRVPASYNSVSDLRATNETTISTVISTTGLSDGHATFNINSEANVFIMSGGKVLVYDVSGGSNRAVGINAAANNINVTGGSFEIRPLTGNTTFNVNSSAPFGDFVVNRKDGTGVVRLDGRPLVVKNNLSITSGVINANNLDVTVGGNFTVANGGTYNSGTNTTLFNGSSNQLFSVSGTLNNGAAGISKLAIGKSAGSLKLTGDATTIVVQSDFTLDKGVFDDGGKTLTIAGNVKNAGTHIGDGKVQMNGSSAQTISGGGVFQNLELNNSAAGAPISLLDHLTIEGQLTFSMDRRFNIAGHNLKMGPNASFVGANANRYVVTSGEAGAGGITKVVSEPGSIHFPVGVANFTPTTITLNGVPNSYGSISVVPVNMEHPNTTIKGRSLSYYWRVKSQGFDLGAATVSHGYVYSNANIVTAGDITEAGYVAARYQASDYSWSTGTVADVDEDNNRIGEPGNGVFLQDVTFIDGEYTAGDNSPVNPFGEVAKFYSRNNDRWNRTQTWSTTGHDGAQAPRIPRAGDAVIIGNSHTVTVTANAFSGSLQIEEGAVLDVQTYTNSNFGTVINHASGNNGLIRVTSNNNNLVRVYSFPQGDFSDFNVNKGTTEFYSTDGRSTAVSILPEDVGSYGNLLLTPFDQDNLVLPNKDVTIYGDLTCQGSDINSWIAISYYNNALYRTIEKTIYIKGDVTVLGGSLIFTDDYAAQHLIVDGDVIVAKSPQAGIDVRGNNWIGGGVRENTMSVGGSLNNNNLFRLANGTRYCDITFHGSNSSQVTNSDGGSPLTIFRKVTVNKGNSQASKLTIDIGGTLNTLEDNWLTLENGTLEYKRINPNSDFTISTVTPFTIPSTAGLWVDFSGNRNVLIANSNSDNNDMFLNGKLTVVNGKVYVGPINTPNNNNDIEYAGGGASAIDVRGGQLVVNGQIRRNPSSASGILKYTQSGGEVIINGRNANTTNAKLEVLNTGSVFNMSGGTLKFVRGGGGNAFGDLYLRPQSSSVTGGDIVFEHNLSGAQQYLLDATVPLNNLRIVGNSASSANATVKLLISPLTLKGNLELINANSVFDANEEYNVGLTLKGNLINNGVFEHRAASTTFNGGVQSVEGTSTTGFYDLKINPVTSVTMTKDVLVGHNLELASGQLLLGETSLTVQGNLTNNATYRNSVAQGGVVLSGGEAEHQISGTGTFGRLELNNANGARLLNDVTLQNDFVLTAGVLNINQHLLTLGENALIVGSGFGSGKMISSDGVYSNVGIRKVFPVLSAATEFTFPMGLGKKYTPAVLTIQQNNRVGAVRVNTINQKHPSAKEPYRVLDYYWEVESSAIEGFNGELNLFYADDDVKQDAGDESAYVAARLLAPGTSWTKAASGADNVFESENRIHFTFTGVDNIGGEYTAGRDEDIPDNVPVYESIGDGEWSDVSIWQPVGDSPPCPVGGPNGSVVHINHEVTVALDYRFAYRTNINGKLKMLNTTFGHNLGAVEGSGTLYLESPLMPAGRFDDFFACSNNATLELGGAGDYYIVADLFSSIPNLKLSGSGSRYWPNKVLTICKSLLVDGATLDNTINNQMMVIDGTFDLVNGARFVAGTGNTATVRFGGSGEQFIGGASSEFFGANAFNNLEVANPAGLTLRNDVEVRGSLLLTQGVIRTTDAELLKLTSSLRNVIAPNGGHAGSFVDGPLSKRIVQGDSFSFPVGKDGVFGNGFTLSAAQGGTIDWIVEYHMPNADYMNFSAPLSYVNSKEYWTVQAPVGSAVRIGAAWTSNSDVTPVITQGGLSDLRISSFDTDANEWKEVASSASGNNTNGVVTSSERLALNNGELRVTTATVNTVKPKAKFTPAAEICGTEQGIPVTFTSSAPIALPYVLTYAIDGVEQPSVTVAALPYVLETPVVGAYQLVNFRYNNGVNEGVVDGDVVSIFATPSTADAGADISDCGATSTLLAGNEPTVGSGLWTIVSGTGGTVLNPTEHNSVFEGTNGTAYTLRWTISNGSCESADEVEVVFPLLAEQPAAFNNYEAEVCQGATVVYSVPLDPTVAYSWSYSGSDVSISGSGHQVSITFGANATSGTLSVVAENDCNVSAARTMEVVVNPMAPVSLTSSIGDATLCVYNNVLFTAVASGADLAFSFYVNDVLQQSGASNEFLAVDLVNGDRVYVQALSEYGCASVSDEILVAVSGTMAMWTGYADSDWNNPMNWCDGQVPAEGSSLLISGKGQGGHPADFNGRASFSGIRVEDGGTMFVKPGSMLTVDGQLLVASDSRFVIENRNGLNGLASVITKGEVIGDAEVDMHLDGQRWFYLSSAIANPTFGELGADDSPFDYRIDIYRKARWISIYPQNAASKLRDMEGYNVKNSVAATRDFSLKGRLYTGEVSREFVEGGWHLLGNPYPSAIDWARTDGWERSNLRETIWFRTQIGEEMVFVTYNRHDHLASHLPWDIDPSFTSADKLSVIPPYQSVWIRTQTNAPAYVTLDNAARLHVAEYLDGDGNVIEEGATTPQLKGGRITSSKDVVRVIASNKYTRDAAVVYFSEENEEGYGTEDSEKYFNSSERIPEVYTRYADKSLVINGLPTLGDGYREVPLSVRNRDKEAVEFSFDLSAFGPSYDVVFVDKKTGAYMPVSHNSTYEYLPDGNGDLHDRFALLFTPAVTTELVTPEVKDNVAEGIRIRSYEGKVLVTADEALLHEGPGLVEIFTIEGRKVSEAKASSSRTLLILPAETGSYIVRATFGAVVKSERVLTKGSFPTGR